MKKNELGKRIRTARESKELTLRVMAKTVKVSVSYLSRIETGDFEDPPSEKVLRAISRVIGVDLDDLCVLAGRIPADLEKFIVQTPGMIAELRKRKFETEHRRAA